MSFKDKLDDFLKKSTPHWHISYDKETFRLKGLHPKNPDTDPDRIPLPYVSTKPIDEDQLHLVEEIQSRGLFHYQVDPETFKIKIRERTEYNSNSDYGNFVRIEFSSDLDLANIDVGISIILEEQQFKIKLLSESARMEYSKLMSSDNEYKMRLYITEYNNPNRLIDTLIVPLAGFSEDGIFKGVYDGSGLPEDVSIYYNKIFEKINFEIK